MNRCVFIVLECFGLQLYGYLNAVALLFDCHWSGYGLYWNPVEMLVVLERVGLLMESYWIAIGFLYESFSNPIIILYNAKKKVSDDEKSMSHALIIVIEFLKKYCSSYSHYRITSSLLFVID